MSEAAKRCKADYVAGTWSPRAFKNLYCELRGHTRFLGNLASKNISSASFKRLLQRVRTGNLGSTNRFYLIPVCHQSASKDEKILRLPCKFGTAVNDIGDAALKLDIPRSVALS